MTNYLILLGCCIVGVIPTFFSKASRRDPLSIGLGIAIGVSLYFAITVGPLFLLAALVFGFPLFLRIKKLRVDA